jgi:hypothetical protein
MSMQMADGLFNLTKTFCMQGRSFIYKEKTPSSALHVGQGLKTFLLHKSIYYPPQKKLFSLKKIILRFVRIPMSIYKGSF